VQRLSPIGIVLGETHECDRRPCRGACAV